MITESNSAASQSQILTLAGPVKYAPVMRQNCLPHVVNRPINTRMTMVDTAAIAHAFAIHQSDVHSSLPQSSVGVNISGFIPARYLDALRLALRRSHLLLASGSSRHSPPPTSSRCRSWNCSTVLR